jgi:glycosyltransferase involved in cell wall biosynthesis
MAVQAVAASDAVHVHGLWDMTNIQLANMASRAGKPYFTSLRGMADDWSMAQKAIKKRVFHEVFQRRYLEAAAAVHCTAQAEYDQAIKWFPRGRGVVIPNLLNLDPFRSPPGPELARQKFPAIKDRPSVLFLSRIHYKKGAEVFLDAARRLADAGKDYVYVLAGSGDAEYVATLEARVRELRLSDRVVFTGHVQNELKVSLYQACDVFALPTSQENFGFVFPESLAAGTPVITTKGVDIWPELVESKGSLIVDRTPEAFADAIVRIVGDPGMRSAMSEAGKAWVMKAFNEESLLDRYVRLYADVLESTQT